MAIDPSRYVDIHSQAGRQGGAYASGGDAYLQGPPGPANVLTIGTVTRLAPGALPYASITGASPAQVLNFGLVDGMPGAGAPTSPDILALTRYSSFVASLRAAGIGADPALFADFIGQTYLGRGAYIGASYTAMLAALSSSFSRSSTATYFDANGVMQTAANNAPRFDHDPATKAARGFLVEQGRTNLLTRSETMTPGWGGAAITIEVSTTPSPSGIGYFTRLTETIADAPHYLVGPTVSWTAGNVHTLSVFSKEPGNNLEKRFLNLLFSFASGIFNTTLFAVFDLATGEVTGKSPEVQAGAIDCGNGVWRCWASATPVGSGVAGLQIRGGKSATNFTSYAGDGVSGVEIWGAQLEVGPQPTSYIPTTTAAVARAADGGVTVQSPSVEISPSAGTVLVDFTPDGVSGFADIAQIDAGDNNTRLLIRWNQARPSTPGVEVFAVYAGVTRVRFNVGPSLVSGQRARVAVSFNGADVFSAMNGVSVAPASLPEAMLGLSRLVTPVSGTAGVATKSLRQTAYFPTTLTDAQLQALSSLTFGS